MKNNDQFFDPIDIGIWSVKKIISVNVKKILLFECNISNDPKKKNRIRTSLEFLENRINF